MTYRIVKLSTVYPQYAARFEASIDPGASYDELLDRFVQDRYGWSDHFARHLRALGRDAHEVVPTLEPLQRAWARDHGVEFSDRSWELDTVRAQMQQLDPDVVFLQDLYHFDRPFRAALRQVLPPHVLFIGWRAATTGEVGTFRDLDLLLSSQPNFVDRFRNAGLDAELLRHGFEPTILDQIGSADTRGVPFSFVGSVGSPEGQHAHRHELIGGLLAETPLEVWSPPLSSINSWKREIKGMAYAANRTLAQAGLSEEVRASIPLIGRATSLNRDPREPTLTDRYPSRWHEPVYGREYFELLGRSQLTFNSHIDAAQGSAGNMRLFEATGMGACLITDEKSDLAELFEPDAEVVTYSTLSECVSKVHALLDDEAAAREIGQRGQRRTLAVHTFADRAARLDRYVTDRLDR